MVRAAAVANSPIFSPSRVPSILHENSSPELLMLNLHGLQAPPSSPSSSSFSFSHPPPSPLTLSLQRHHPSGVGDCNCTDEPSAPSPRSRALLKRMRPAKIHIPMAPLNMFAVDSLAVVETADYMEAEGEGYSAYCKRGKKGVMEDRYSTLVRSCGDSKQAFFGVFDGHGGAKAAEFAAENLGTNIMDEASRSKGKVEEAIRSGYLITDAEFLKEDVNGGTCCVTALIHNNQMAVSNVGDCRAVMSQGGVAEALTSDHRASRKDERDRIETMGGYVDCHRGVWRIQGSLAVSRGIGDSHLKQWVIAEPKTEVIRIKPEFEFLILASDGLWDKVTNQEAVDMVRPLCIGVDKPEPFSACKNLAELSVRRGSADDVTVMIIQLGHLVS